MDSPVLYVVALFVFFITGVAAERLKLRSEHARGLGSPTYLQDKKALIAGMKEACRRLSIPKGYGLPDIRLRLRAIGNPDAAASRAGILPAFLEHESRLLIVGPAGSGKTTLLADLASDLLARISDEDLDLIPVVFNLSGWQEQTEAGSIAEWLIRELQATYQVEDKAARLLVRTKHIIPLLDGLDEVEEGRRLLCRQAIESFCVNNYAGVGICVSTRPLDDPNGTSIASLTTLSVLALTDDDVSDQLEKAGEPMVELLALWHSDEATREVLRSPLTLSMAMACSRERKDFSRSWTAADPESRLAALTGAYVDVRLQREPRAKHSLNYSVRWLSGLATLLRRMEASRLRLDVLDSRWLASKLERLACRTVTAALIGVLVGSLGLVDLGGPGAYFGLLSSLVSGLASALLFLLAPSLIRPLPGRPTGFAWSRLRLRMSDSRRAGLQGLSRGRIAGRLLALLQRTAASLSERFAFQA